MEHIIFAYGTLLDKEVLSELLGRSPKTFPSSLKGFRLDTINLDNIDYPIIIEDSSANEPVKGEYFNVNDLELKELDIYESDAYRRIRVILNNGLQAWVYCL